MNEAANAWWNFGYYGISACVFLEQIGVPIPAFPALLAAGALVAAGDLNLWVALAVAVASALCADIIWYFVGRVKGGAVLSLICRFSWKPDTCVSKTKSVFSEHGTKTLFFSKFIPGLSTLASPLAGITQVPFSRFVLFDGIGAILWASAPLVAGAYLQKSYTALQNQIHSLIPLLPWICGFLIISILIWRFIERRKFVQQLQTALTHGIKPDDLHARLEQGEDIVLLDIRHPIDMEAKPLLLPQARWISYHELPKRVAEISLDKPIVTYCDCTKDQGAVAMAEFLREQGAKDVRPLLGGIKGWVSRGYPVLPLPVPVAA